MFKKLSLEQIENKYNKKTGNDNDILRQQPSFLRQNDDGKVKIKKIYNTEFVVNLENRNERYIPKKKNNKTNNLKG